MDDDQDKPNPIRSEPRPKCDINLVSAGAAEIIRVAG